MKSRKARHQQNLTQKTHYPQLHRLKQTPGFIRIQRFLHVILWIVVFSLSGLSLATAEPVQSASELDYPPFSIVQDDGSASGFSVELMRAALEAMGREVTFDVRPWASIKKDLIEGRLETLPLVGRSPEREKVFDFTVPYITLYGAVFVHDDTDDIKEIYDLSGRRVGVMLGDNAEEYMLRENLTDKLITTSSFEEAFEKLSRGELDAVVAQRLVGLNLIDMLKLDNLKTAVAPIKGFSQDFCFAVTKGNRALLAQLNEGLAVIIADGTYDTLRNKWLGILEREEKQLILFLKIAAIVLLIVAFVLLSLFLFQFWRGHQNLKTSEERLRALVQNMPVILNATNSEGKIIAWNKEAERATGYSADFIIENAKADTLLYPEKQYRDQMLAERQKRGDHRGWEWRVTAKDGAERNIEWSNISGQFPVPGWSSWSIGVDVTERKKAEKELKNYQIHLEELVEERTKELAEAKEVAETANRAKSIFLANMSHEFRTPLNAILGFSEMLERDRDTKPSQHEKVSIITRSGGHLLNMINDVLDFSKIEARRMELDPEAFDLPLMLKDIGNMFEVRAARTQLRFKLELDPMLAKYIKTDIGKLRQIIINLLGNAMKFTAEGGVTLRARTQSIESDPAMLTLQLEVEDSGSGIATAQLERIFEPFVQGEQASTVTKGTGLGLTISKSFVELMSGKISVQSTPGKGSRFRVDLPVVLADAADLVSAKTSGPQVLGLAPGQPMWRILIAEDNTDGRLLLNSLLVQVGFDVREAKNGEEAIALFEQWQPHFIWMDMRMPVMDGYEATAKIRALPGGDKVKIVAITASAFEEQRKVIIEAGCDTVVHKPYKSYEIFDTMTKYLGVKFLYEDEAEAGPEGGTTQQKVVLTSEMMEDLPPDLTKELKEAAYNMDILATNQAIERISSTHLNVANGLKQLAEQFQFEQILDLFNGQYKKGSAASKGDLCISIAKRDKL